MCFFDRGVGDRDRREQGLGVRVVGRREHLVGGALLGDRAEIHYDHAVREVAHQRQIVADEQERGAVLALDLHEQLGDRRLHRDVERGDRLVGDHHARLPANARAMPTRCFWPPDSWRGRRK